MGRTKNDDAHQLNDFKFPNKLILPLSAFRIKESPTFTPSDYSTFSGSTVSFNSSLSAIHTSDRIYGRARSPEIFQKGTQAGEKMSQRSVSATSFGSANSCEFAASPKDPFEGNHSISATRRKHNRKESKSKESMPTLEMELKTPNTPVTKPTISTTSLITENLPILMEKSQSLTPPDFPPLQTEGVKTHKKSVSVKSSKDFARPIFGVGHHSSPSYISLEENQVKREHLPHKSKENLDDLFSKDSLKRSYVSLTSRNDISKAKKEILDTRYLNERTSSTHSTHFINFLPIMLYSGDDPGIYNQQEKLKRSAIEELLHIFQEDKYSIKFIKQLMKTPITAKKPGFKNFKYKWFSKKGIIYYYNLKNTVCCFIFLLRLSHRW